MKHLDLFSGIGGFALAADKVFGEVEHTFVEYDPFCQTIIRKHWPHSQIYGDIRSFATDTESEQNRRVQQSELQSDTGTENEIFILTGGFPCQPFSQAGRRKGTEDDRYLWPEMFRVIRATQPTWVIAENVRGLVTWNDGMVLETVCSDLESEGYEVQPLIIPAVAVGAPHRRDRVWIVAHRPDSGVKSLRQRRKDKISGFKQTSTDTRQQLRSEGSGEGVETDTPVGTTCTEANQRKHQYTWADDWREVAFATCHDSVDDGIPRRMGGITISGAKNRKESLKAYGNAIVPQVAMRIFEDVKETLSK